MIVFLTLKFLDGKKDGIFGMTLMRTRTIEKNIFISSKAHINNIQRSPKKKKKMFTKSMNDSNNSIVLYMGI